MLSAVKKLKMKALPAFLALSVLSIFSVQSVALPVHAFQHAIHSQRQAADVAAVDADCQLCFAFHASTSFIFDIPTVIPGFAQPVPRVVYHAEEIFRRVASLPGARAPPGFALLA